MNHIVIKSLLLMCVVLGISPADAAVDSYRFAHVTIATPWYIFIFLLMGIFAPFVLMAVLAWRNAIRRAEQDAANADQNSSNK